jgi:hypothetical protein
MGYVKIPAATNRTVDFTSSGTWTCPSGVYSAEFLVVGAGGGGGGGQNAAATDYSAGGGGGGGAVKRVQLATVPGSNYTITIGAKGTGANNTAGTNAGFSEIVLSGTTLIRSNGGQGGGASTGSATISRTIGGGGGQGQSGSTSTPAMGGGGGGALSGALSNIITNNFMNSSEGSVGQRPSTTQQQEYTSFGAPGIDGYGAGGAGGMAGNISTVRNTGGYSYFAGSGAVQTTTGVSNGGAATANTGGGGGGGAGHTNTTAYSGGNGADGLVRITYFA